MIRQPPRARVIARACVIGWPISHSRSPLIHRYWLDAHKIPGDYQAVAVAPDDLAKFFDELRAGAYVGGNVTVPHKAEALRLADTVDNAAQAVGAANTLIVHERRIEARNTDIHGFLANLDAGAPGWRERGGPAAVIGAGGAARAVVWALIEAGVAPILVANRTRRRADDLAAKYPSRIEVWDWDQRHAALAGARLVVNTTTLGMAGQPPLDLELDGLADDAVVSDLVYVPLITPLLAAARARGLTTVDGLGMLLHQAAPGFAAWFGILPEVTDELRRHIVADIEAAS